MQWKLHVRFGGRAAETHPAKAGQGAAARPLQRVPDQPRQALPRTIRDLHHRGIVGWDTAARQDSILVVNALTMALTCTGHPADVIHHSDKGTQQPRAGSHGNNATVQLGQQVRASRDPVVR